MELALKNILLIVLLTLPCFSYSAQTWTDWRGIGNIYTYTDEDTLYIYLNGITCPNTKDYFTIHPSVASNAKQLISMILAAKMTKTQVNILYDPEENPTFCYIKGLILKN
jgi:hypothetical protein